MGKIYKISCKCGYEKKLYIGGGLASCNINMVNRVFLEEKRKEFDHYNNNKEVQSFFVENELSFCDKCKEIMTIAVLKAQLINNRKLKIVNDCHTCNNKIQILNDIYMCPRCSQEIIKEEIGDWD